MNILGILGSGFLGGVLGAWVFWRFRLFSREWVAVPDASVMPAPREAYEVRLARQSSHGAFYKTLYVGDNLQEAKRIWRSAKGPARTKAELWTQGNHTASRAV